MCIQVVPCPRGYITITCLHKGEDWSVGLKERITISYADHWFLRIQKVGIANQEWSEDFTIQQKQSSLQQR